MEIIKEINLNITQPNNFQLVNVMQGTVDSIKVIAHLYDRNEPYQIPDTVNQYQILGILPSGKYLIDDQLTQYDDTSVTFLINQNMMAKAGYVKFSISLVDSADQSIAETFPAKIMVTAIPGQDYEQTDEIPIITEALQEVKEGAAETKEYYNKLISEKGNPNGIATLDENTKVPLDELYEATTSSKGITQLEDSIASTSITTAATPNSVKTVNDALQAEITRATTAENNLDSKKVDKTTVATLTNLGLVKSGTDITVDSSGNVSVNDNSHNHTVSNISDLMATANELNVLDGITASTDELNYTDGVTSNIQTQLDAKAPLATPRFTGTPKAPTASAGTNTTQIATTEFVQTAVSNGIAASDAMIIKGTIGTSGTITALPTTYKTGWTYRVVTTGTYAGQVCEIGDLIIALVDRDGSDNADADWCVAQTNINGAITGIKSGDAYIATSQSGSVTTITHNDVSRNDTTSTAKPSHGGTFTALKSVASDSKGHITGVDTETVNLPTYDTATQSTDGLESAADKMKLDGIATGAEVNQNAFSNITVDSTTIAADAKTDTLTFASGDNVTLTPDAANDKITISSSHPSITTSTDTTSTASPSSGGTFTTVDSITRDANGHVTKVNTKTVTLPNTSVAVDDTLSSTSTNPVQNKVIDSALNTKLSLSGGTMTGDLILKNKLVIHDGVYNRPVMYAYDDGDNANYGCEVVINSSGNMFIGGGESPAGLRTALQSAAATGESYSQTGENMYITADSNIYLYSGASNDGTTRTGIVYDASGSLRPLVNNTRTLGSSSIKWNNIYATTFTGNLSGNASSSSTSTYSTVSELSNTSATTYYPVMTSVAQTNSALVSPNNAMSLYVPATTTNNGVARLTLGNTTTYGTTGSMYGSLRLYHVGSSSATTKYYADLRTSTNLTANRTIYLPDLSGTLGLKNDACMYKLSSAQTLPDTSSNKLELATSVNNTNTSLYTLSSDNGIKIATAGTYMISLHTFYATGISAGDRLVSYVYKNNTIAGASSVRAGTNGTYECVDVSNLIITAAAGDIIYAYATNYTRANTVVNDTYSYLSIVRLI